MVISQFANKEHIMTLSDTTYNYPLFTFFFISESMTMYKIHNVFSPAYTDQLSLQLLPTISVQICQKCHSNFQDLRWLFGYIKHFKSDCVQEVVKAHHEGGHEI